MATAIQPPASLPAPTRPRLQGLNQAYTNLNNQIYQAAHIIGLPDDWETSRLADGSSLGIRAARADWVLRWILEKLKHVDTGAQSRGTIQAWKLLNCMIEALPVSRCAPHLRDADFLTILEKALEENFGGDVTIQPEPTHQFKHPRDDSSETMQEGPQPSRKRKRDSGASIPSKRTAIESSTSVELFDAIRTTVRSIREKGDTQGSSEAMIQSEHMRMVLRTESAQAARILKNWLNAVQRIIPVSPIHDSAEASTSLDLSLAVDIWELRTIDPKDDSGASVDQFSTECLLTSLHLSQTLRHTNVGDRGESYSKLLDQALLVLDRLVAKHILVPSRVAFFDDSIHKAAEDTKSTFADAELLSSSLEPLTAKLLQAAQIQDSDEVVPAYFTPLFAAVPCLMDLVIRSSPARTPKARTTERSWIQAALVALAQCVGCSLVPPDFAAPVASIAALEKCLAILASRNVSIDTKILRNLFLFHSGIKYPLQRERIINWSFIAALVEIDPSIFLIDPKSSIVASGNGPDDLALLFFRKVSAFESNCNDAADKDEMKIDDKSHTGFTFEVEENSQIFTRNDLVNKIIIPIMSAFSKNRQLPDFIDRWEKEIRATYSSPELLAQLSWQASAWQDRGLVLAFAEVFEQSLTITQISALFEKHGKQLKQYGDKDPSEALSSAVIINVMIQSIKSDEVIEALKPYLLSIWNIHSEWVRTGGAQQFSALELSWASLSYLLGHLWHIHFHGSPALQKEFVRPLLERASEDVTASRKVEPNDGLKSFSHTAAIVFGFVACDFLSSLPDGSGLVEKRLPKILKALSPDNLDTRGLELAVELFCAEYAQLLGSFGLGTAQKMLTRLFETLSDFGAPLRDELVETLSKSVFTGDRPDLRTAFISVLLSYLKRDADNYRVTSLRALLQVAPSSLSREQRSTTLNKLLELLRSSPDSATLVLNTMNHLTTAPNPQFKGTHEADTFFEIGRVLHESGMESAPVTQLLQSLVQSTLGHLVPNRDQEQNKVFFEAFGNKVVSVLQKPKSCSPTEIAVLTGALLATHQCDLLAPTQSVEFLTKVLRSSATQASTSVQEAALGALNQIPGVVLGKDENGFHTAQGSLQKWLFPKVPFENPMQLRLDTFPAELWPTVLGTIAKYQLFPNAQWLLRISSRLLSKGQSARSMLMCLKEALEGLQTPEKLSLVPLCISIAEDAEPVIGFQLLGVVISTLEDKQETETELKTQKMYLLPQICSLLGGTSDIAAFSALLDTIDTILRHKPNMTSQHNIECIITILHKLSTRSGPRFPSAHAPVIYTRLCETTRLVLLLHRSRFGGRFHILLPLLQSLLLCLFIPNLNRGAALPPWLDSTTPTRLTPTNAAQYTHLLSTLCSPTQSSVQRTRSATTLNDPIKTAREYTSQYVYPLLSSFCRFTLYGRLDGAVREKLMPGMWEVVDLARMDEGSVEAMFAGLGRSERDVWRGVWGEWSRVHGRREGKGRGKGKE